MLIAWQSGICATQIPSQKDIPTHFEDSYVELSLPHPILIIFGKFIGRNEFWDSGTQGPVEYIVLQRCNHAPQKERRIREEERRKTRFLVHWEGMKFVKVYPYNWLKITICLKHFGGKNHQKLWRVTVMVSFFLKLELSAFALKGNSDFGALMASVDNEVAAFQEHLPGKVFRKCWAVCVCVFFWSFTPTPEKKGWPIWANMIKMDPEIIVDIQSVSNIGPPLKHFQSWGMGKQKPTPSCRHLENSCMVLSCEPPFFFLAHELTKIPCNKIPFEVGCGFLIPPEIHWLSPHGRRRHSARIPAFVWSPAMSSSGFFFSGFFRCVFVARKFPPTFFGFSGRVYSSWTTFLDLVRIIHSHCRTKFSAPVATSHVAVCDSIYFYYVLWVHVICHMI